MIIKDCSLGESYHMEFVEDGQLVIIQPSERLSGLQSGGVRLGID